VRVLRYVLAVTSSSTSCGKSTSDDGVVVVVAVAVVVVVVVVVDVGVVVVVVLLDHQCLSLGEGHSQVAASLEQVLAVEEGAGHGRELGTSKLHQGLEVKALVEGDDAQHVAIGLADLIDVVERDCKSDVRNHDDQCWACGDFAEMGHHLPVHPHCQASHRNCGRHFVVHFLTRRVLHVNCLVADRGRD